MKNCNIWIGIIFGILVIFVAANTNQSTDISDKNIYVSNSCDCSDYNYHSNISKIKNDLKIPSINVSYQSYIGNIDSIDNKLISLDVCNSDIEIFNDVVYIAFARYSSGAPTIHICKYWISNHTLSKIKNIAIFYTHDHFSVSMDIDVKGYIHIAWGTHTSQQKYICSKYPEDIRSWIKVQDFCDFDATYRNLRCYGDTVYNLYRDGRHGAGWKIIYKNREHTTWSQVKVVDGSGFDPDHLYLNMEGQMYFEDPEHIYLAPFWTYDFGDGGNGTRQYQRVTRYNFSNKKHHHLNGSLIRYRNSSTLPHDGPKYYYGQCGDIIHNSVQLKYTGSGLQQLGRLLLGVDRTGWGIVVLGNIGENESLNYPPRTLLATIWNGSILTQNILDFPFNEDVGTHHVQHCQGANNETIWLVGRKPTNGYIVNSTTDITILRNTDNGHNWTFENFTNDDSNWQFKPEAVYSSTYGEYIITWHQSNGDAGKGNNLYIKYSQVIKFNIDDNFKKLTAVFK
jgi:hypothetical protein